MSFNHAALFEVIARAVPDREAIVFRDRRLTYADVVRRSGSLRGRADREGAREPEPRDTLSNWQSGQDHVGLYLHNGNETSRRRAGANRAQTVPSTSTTATSSTNWPICSTTPSRPRWCTTLRSPRP